MRNTRLLRALPCCLVVSLRSQRGSFIVLPSIAVINSQNFITYSIHRFYWKGKNCGCRFYSVCRTVLVLRVVIKNQTRYSKTSTDRKKDAPFYLSFSDSDIRDLKVEFRRSVIEPMTFSFRKENSSLVLCTFWTVQRIISEVNTNEPLDGWQIAGGDNAVHRDIYRHSKYTTYFQERKQWLRRLKSNYIPLQIISLL